MYADGLKRGQTQKYRCQTCRVGVPARDLDAFFSTQLRLFFSEDPAATNHSSALADEVAQHEGLVQGRKLDRARIAAIGTTTKQRVRRKGSQKQPSRTKSRVFG